MTRQARHRLGLAVEVLEPARAALAHALEPLQAAFLGVHWVPEDRWYVDLCELSAIDDVDAERVDAEADVLAAVTPPIALRLDGGLGMAGRATLFAGVEDSLAFAELQTAVLERFSQAGLPVTAGDALARCVIGRVPGGRGLGPASLRTFRGPLVSWTARRLVVVRTRLRLGGVAVEERSARPFGLPLGLSRSHAP